MRVACAFDHAGVPLRETVLKAVHEAGQVAQVVVGGCIDRRVVAVDPLQCRCRQEVGHDYVVKRISLQLAGIECGQVGKGHG